MSILNQNSALDSEILHPKVVQSVVSPVARKLVFRPNILIPEPSRCCKLLSDSMRQIQTQFNECKKNSQREPQRLGIKIRQTDDSLPLNIQIPIVEPNNHLKTNNNEFNCHLTAPQGCFQRHPQSLFQTPNQQGFFNSINSQLFCGKSFYLFKKQNPAISQNQNSQKLKSLKLQNDLIRNKKTRTHQKDGHVKTRKGKNKQPMTQKFIKKFSGFHYSKNYKQNRNKTLKKIVKRGLSINLENFTSLIAKLKLSVNRKFIRPDMKIKTNSKGEQIDPKKYFNQYHESFSTEKQRQFIEKLYSQVFKAVYVTMWKSDERLRRVEDIPIEGQEDKHCKQVTSQIKQEYESVSEQIKIQKDSSKQQQNYQINESKATRKRKAFVECLDEQGKLQLELVFDKQYESLYDSFDWGNQQNQKPEKGVLLSRIQNFCKIQD